MKTKKKLIKEANKMIDNFIFNELPLIYEKTENSKKEDLIKTICKGIPDPYEDIVRNIIKCKLALKNKELSK